MFGVWKCDLELSKGWAMVSMALEDLGRLVSAVFELDLISKPQKGFGLG